VRTNGFHPSTKILDRRKSLVFVQNNKVIETAFAASSGLYWIAIRPSIVSSFALSCKINKVSFWHERLGHPGSISFKKIIPYIAGHNLQPTYVNSMALCKACMQDKLIIKQFLWKLPYKLSLMLLRLYGDICSSVNPMFEPF